VNDDARSAQERHWNHVAGGWAEWLEWTERNFRPLTTWLAGTAGWVPGAQVADVACGAGYPALEAAAHVSPGGVVHACDLSPVMTEAAAAAARVRGIANVPCHTMDAEALEFGDGTLDAVTNTYGLMFCPDPERTLREAWRVLKTGGRLSVVTWDDPAASPFFTVISGVAARHLSLKPPQAGEPGPFRFASPETLDALLRTAGFEEVRVARLPMTFECASVDEYCRLFGDVAWKSKMDVLSEADKARFRADVALAAGPYAAGAGFRLPASSWCASGRKP
jgi:ubiquinone/menaquinone biosynthesis C-methylase UbiE